MLRANIIYAPGFTWGIPLGQVLMTIARTGGFLMDQWSKDGGKASIMIDSDSLVSPKDTQTPVFD